MDLVICTESKIKVSAVTDVLKPQHIITSNTSDAPLPAQPINSGLSCCHQRIDYVKSSFNKSYDLIIAIENGIDTITHLNKEGDHKKYVDICYVVIENHQGNRYEGESVDHYIPIPKKYVDRAREVTSSNYSYGHLGYEVTAGDLIKQDYPDIDNSNWMLDSRFYGISRSEQIKSALYNCVKKMSTYNKY